MPFDAELLFVLPRLSFCRNRQSFLDNILIPLSLILLSSLSKELYREQEKQGWAVNFGGEIQLL